MFLFCSCTFVLSERCIEGVCVYADYCTVLLSSQIKLFHGLIMFTFIFLEELEADLFFLV